MIKLMLIQFSMCAAAGMLTACTGQAPVTDLAPVVRVEPAPSIGTDAAPSLDSNPRDVRTRLLAHYATWRGTPHVWGGLSRNGVDCSGYIFHAYRDLFARTLPRTTRAQARLGQGINRSQLRDGDLVFFKIAPGKHHAGIYVGNGRFAHASYSKGVTISALDGVYWKRRYWQSRRLL